MITLEPDGKAEYACIVLHGLGANGSDLSSLAGYLWPNPKVRWLFPDAPIRPITINGGLPMRGWYDVTAMRLADQDDDEGIRTSAEFINQLIDKQSEFSIGPEKIVLAGFSQGGVMSLHVTIRRTKPLAACVAMSAYLPFAKQLANQAQTNAKTTPIFCAAGQADPVIAMEDTKAGAEQLIAAGFAVKFCQYPMEHNIIPEEISDIGKFLTEKVA